MSVTEIDEYPGTSKKVTIHLDPQDTRLRYFPKHQHYFTNRMRAVTKGMLTKPVRQFISPKPEKLLSYIKYSDINSKRIQKNRLALSVLYKDNPRSAAMKDLSSRLFIKEPRDDVKAVVEIHPEFFSVIKGRPLRPKDDIKVYMSSIRQYAMHRQQIGYRNDIMISLQTTKDDELSQYKEIAGKIKNHIHNFQQFLTEDYKKACQKIKKTDNLMAVLETANIELLTTALLISKLNNDLYVLDSIRSVLNVYRRFLIHVAPIPWREQYDETLVDRDDTLQYISEAEFMNEDDLVNSTDIDKIVEVAKIELKNSPPAYMYFKKPEEMMCLLRAVELQSREYFIHCARNKFPFILLRETMQQLKQTTKQESDYFQYNIDRFKESIDRECKNEIYLKDRFFGILHRSFYDSVAGQEALRLNTCIEYVYVQIFGACESHTNISQPMRELEVLYEKYSLNIESLDFHIVNSSFKETFTQDLRKQALAIQAQKELKSFNEMTNSIKKAFSPPAKFKRVVPQKIEGKKKRNEKSDINVSKANKVSSLTANDRDALLTFTNWCEGTDPTLYLKQYYKYVQPVLDWKRAPSSP